MKKKLFFAGMALLALAFGLALGGCPMEADSDPVVTYQVSYDGNGSTGGAVPAGETYASGATVTVAGNTGELVKTGHTFAGWNTLATGGGINYTAGNTFLITANTTLYARWTPTPRVTYDGNGNTGGTVPAGETYAPGATVTVAGNTGNLVKTGHTFTGWNTKADGSGANYAADTTFTITAGTTLYARWTPEGQTPTDYTVTYDGNGSDDGTVPLDSATYNTDATVTVLGNTGSLVKIGHTFAGWNTLADGTGTNYTAGGTFTITADTTLYAKWTPTYTVSYDGNSSTGGTSPVDNAAYASGATVTVKGKGNLVKTGYTFAGWNTQEDGGGTDYAAGGTFTINADTTLYATWTPTYTVSYDGNGSTGGTAPVDNAAYAYGATVTVKGNTGNLVKTGLIFAGWNTQADGTGTGYTAGGTFPITGNTTLYARWRLEDETYTVTYNGSGNDSGDVPTDSTEYPYGATVTVLDNTGGLERAGYIFDGWIDGSSGDNYVAGGTFNITEDTTLYAQWMPEDEEPETYTVTYDGNGNTGGSVPSDTTAYTSGYWVEVAGNTGGLEKDGYIFAGWNTNSSGWGTNYAAGEEFPIYGNTILYAKWTPIYRVTYNANGSDSGLVPTDPTAYTSGDYATVLGNTGNLVKEGYIFDGWNTRADGIGSNYAAGYEWVYITGNTTLYANWAPTYRVTYNGNGNTDGSVPTDTTAYTSGYLVGVAGNTGNLVKAGWNFAGWNAQMDGTGTDYTEGVTFNIYGNTTLYAKWNNAPDNPLPMTFDDHLTRDRWTEILKEIQTAGNYVALDLSACTMTGTEFDATIDGYTNTGKTYVVSLILPSAATSIKAGINFQSFTSLVSVQGDNIETIGDTAFANCTSLTTVNFPDATTIGNYAFANCTSLTTVNFPKAETINLEVFANCTSLTTVNFPNATTIGQMAFWNCTNLTTVRFPKATTIVSLAFYECTSLTTVDLSTATSIDTGAFGNTGTGVLTVILPQNAPELIRTNGDILETYSKAVTIKTPAGKTGYDDTWQEDFKRLFGYSNSSTITLNFQNL